MAFIIIAFLVGGYSLLKAGLALQSIFRQEQKVEDKVAHVIYFRLVLSSLLLGSAVASLFVNWSHFDGSWIALPCFNVLFLFGTMRLVQASKSDTASVNKE
ncbi:MAG: hypothetical protein KC445_08215 [Anaerolineales bacterium]|nr:hypothetical protein [Anaerolineales bacterium]